MGLVISLWATLEKAIPYFPVAVFLVATAAMHGAGLYTLKYWRLKATSRGLLLVSTLLVPLNVLAAIALNDRNPVYGPIDYAAVSVGLAVLAAIVYSAARILNKHNPWPMFAGRGGRGRRIVLHRPAGEPRRVGRANPVVVRAPVCVVCRGRRGSSAAIGGRTASRSTAGGRVVPLLRHRPLLARDCRGDFSLGNRGTCSGRCRSWRPWSVCSAPC